MSCSFFVGDRLLFRSELVFAILADQRLFRASIRKNCLNSQFLLIRDSREIDTNQQLYACEPATNCRFVSAWLWIVAILISLVVCTILCKVCNMNKIKKRIDKGVENRVTGFTELSTKNIVEKWWKGIYTPTYTHYPQKFM